MPGIKLAVSKDGDKPAEFIIPHHVYGREYLVHNYAYYYVKS